LWVDEDMHKKEESKPQSREDKRVLATLWFEEGLRNKIVMDARSF
jgi:hypothetical protein